MAAVSIRMPAAAADRTLDVFVCADEAMAAGLFVTIASLLEQFGDSHRPRVNVIDCGLAQASRHSLEKFLSGHPKQPEGRIVRLNPADLTAFATLKNPHGGNRIRPSTLGRIMIPYYFPQSSFGIYVDSDFLVQRDLTRLAALADQAAPMFGVRDLTIQAIKQDVGAERCRRHGVDPEAPYFNGGFQVLNLHRWDRAAHFDELKKIAAAGPLHWEDQSLLNLRFAGQWEAIDPDWDCFVNPSQWEYFRPRNTCNYHFYGLNKPWAFSRHFSPGLPARFHRTLAQCKPFELRPAPRKPYSLWVIKNVLLREGFRAWRHSSAS